MATWLIPPFDRDGEDFVMVEMDGHLFSMVLKGNKILANHLMTSTHAGPMPTVQEESVFETEEAAINAYKLWIAEFYTGSVLGNVGLYVPKKFASGIFAKGVETIGVEA